MAQGKNLSPMTVGGVIGVAVQFERFLRGDPTLLGEADDDERPAPDADQGGQG